MIDFFTGSLHCELDIQPSESIGRTLSEHEGIPEFVFSKHWLAANHKFSANGVLPLSQICAVSPPAFGSLRFQRRHAPPNGLMHEDLAVVLSSYDSELERFSVTLVSKFRTPLEGGVIAELSFRCDAWQELENGGWAAAGFIDTLLRWKMKLEVVHGNEKAIQPGIQA